MRVSAGKCWVAVAACMGALLGQGATPLQPTETAPSAPFSVVPSSSPARSPVEAFRELLAMTPAERKAFLAARPPEVQRQIMSKVREYLALRPAERDVRLEVTELYYYLWPLMKSPATNRAARLALIPERKRQEVEVRLRDWDKLPAIKQQELLTNAVAIRHFIEIQLQPPLPVLSPGRQQKLESGIQRWQTLREEQRKQITARFSQFFNLTDAEKQKALQTLSEPERRQIQKTLDKFASLTPAERDDCLACFEKLANLSPAERQQFLKKAERWSALSSDERQEWRQLVDDLTREPPLPPGVVPPIPTDQD